MFRILIFATALIGAMMAAHADVYRWTDPQGHVQYSDRWVPGSTLIKTTGTHNAATPAPPQQSSDQQKLAASNAAIADQQQQRQAQQTVQQDVAASRAEQCKKATEAYQKSIDSRRLYKEGKNGEREYLSDGEIDAYRAKLLNERQQVCGK
jgi:anti-sigma28 factor (negative regulator of flagellin synthesis)